MADFELASRMKFRFETTIGLITVEDLWALPLTSTVGKPNLDDVARDLHRRLKNDDNVSFVNPEQKSDEVVQAKFDIVRHVIDVKLAENKAREEAAARRRREQKILEIIDRKQDQSLEGKTIDELRKELESL